MGENRQRSSGNLRRAPVNRQPGRDAEGENKGRPGCRCENHR
jgi:hypothetical protein